MTASTGFCADIDNGRGNTLGGLMSSMRPWLERSRSQVIAGLFVASMLIGSVPMSVSAADDPASFIGDLGSRALGAMQNGNAVAAKQVLFRQLFRQYFDVETCARSALGSYWNGATAQQRQEFVKLYEDYVVIGYSAHLSALGGESFKVLGSHPDKKSVIVASRIQINGAAPIGVDWQLNRTNDGYKVTRHNCQWR